MEHAVNPGVATFSDAFYFTVVALTTVGFGDIVPVTRLGRAVTVGAILAAVILIPWQAGRIVRAWTGPSREKVDMTCPNCGSPGTTRTRPTARPAGTSSGRSTAAGSESNREHRRVDAVPSPVEHAEPLAPPPLQPVE